MRLQGILGMDVSGVLVMGLTTSYGCFLGHLRDEIMGHCRDALSGHLRGMLFGHLRGDSLVHLRDDF